MSMRTLLLAISITALSSALAAPASAGDRTPILLSVEAPVSTFAYPVRRNGIRTLVYPNWGGILPSTQWPLILRAETSSAVGFALETQMGKRRGALVLADPDNCFNLASLVADFGDAAYDFNCAGLAEDETYLQVLTEKYDSFELEDNSSTGNDRLRAELVDDSCMDDESPRNVACLALDNGQVKAVGPKTGGEELDGYGYGTDDDVAGLVIMADVGAARVFDPEAIESSDGSVRNLAGFVNTVSSELLTGRRTTALTMTTHALAGYLEPIALFDLSLGEDASAAGEYNTMVQVDGSAARAVKVIADYPTGNNSDAISNDFYDELLSLVYPTTVIVRAVLVAGEAPATIDDLDGDGRYTAADVRLAGYQLLSNEVKLAVRHSNDNLLVESGDPKCLPRTAIYKDLDGDGDNGEPPEGCLGTSGSTRTRRIPI